MSDDCVAMSHFSRNSIVRIFLKCVGHPLPRAYTFINYILISSKYQVFLRRVILQNGSEVPYHRAVT